MAAALFCSLVTFTCLAGTKNYKITFTEGYRLINPLTGKQATHVFTGTVPESISVPEGASFIFPENTIIFRDYIFVSWKQVITDTDGKKTNVYYNPGDVYSGVTGNMQIDAVWKRPDPIELVFTGYMSFLPPKGFEADTLFGSLPETIGVTFGKEYSMPDCDYVTEECTLSGWVDNEGVFYHPGDTYKVNKYNPRFFAVMEYTDSPAEFTTITFNSGAISGVKQLPGNIKLYKTNTFTVPSSLPQREGFDLACYTDPDGNRYLPGKEYSVPDAGIILTAEWVKKIVKYNVSVTVNGNGSVSPSGSYILEEGQSLMLTFTPVEESYVSDVVINGASVGAVSEYNISNISSNVLVNVVFADYKYYSIKINQAEGGKAVLLEDRSRFKEGSTAAFAVSCYDGYVLDSIVVEGGELVQSGDAYSVSDIRGDIVISATFLPVAVSSGNSEISSGESHPKDESGDASGLPTEPGDQATRVYIVAGAALAVILLVGYILLGKRKK